MKFRFALAMIALVALISLNGCESSDTSATSAAPSESTESADAEAEELLDESDPAYQLAVIDVSAVPTSADVALYAAALKRLQKMCDNSQTQLADYTVNAQQLVRDNGDDEPLLIDVLNSVYEAAAVEPGGDCEDEYLLNVTTMTEQP